MVYCRRNLSIALYYSWQHYDLSGDKRSDVLMGVKMGGISRQYSGWKTVLTKSSRSNTHLLTIIYDWGSSRTQHAKTVAIHLFIWYFLNIYCIFPTWVYFIVLLCLRVYIIFITTTMYIVLVRVVKGEVLFPFHSCRRLSCVYILPYLLYLFFYTAD